MHRMVKQAWRWSMAGGVWLALIGTSWAQGPAGGAPGTGSKAPIEPKTAFQIIFSGGWVGITIMIFLIALSITAVYLIIDHYLTIRRRDVIPEGLSNHVRELLMAGKLAEADKACREEPSFLSFVLIQGIAEIDGGWSAVEKALEDAIAEQSARLFRKIEYLSVLANIAPMVGLLGTVVGLVMAFKTVAETQGTAGASELAEGIYTALVTTIAGLLIAIPALGAFAVFRNRVDEFVAEAAYAALHAVAPLKRRRVPTRTQGSPPPPPAREGG